MAIFPIFKIPYPNAKEGINLKTHYIFNPVSLVFGITLNTKIIIGTIDPIIK